MYSGDADLYVRFGTSPTDFTYDCAPYLGDSNETCTFSAAQAGVYYISIKGFTTFSSVSLVASYAGP